MTAIVQSGVYAHRSALIPTESIPAQLEQIVRALNGKLENARDTLERSPLFIAIRFASASLADDILQCSAVGGDGRTEALLLTVEKYARRAAQRATPFGTFAGVGGIEGHAQSVELGTVLAVSSDDGDHVVRVLGDLVAPGSMLYSNLSVRFSPTRVVVPEVALAESGSTTRMAWVRRTAMVDAAWQLCAAGMLVEDLARVLTERSGQSGDERVRSFIRKLSDSQILFALPDAMTAHEFVSGRPQTHTEVPLEIPEGRILWSLAETVAAPSSDVQRRVDRAVHVLAKMQQPSPYQGSIDAYANKFLARYGAGLRVSVLDATDESKGVGFISLDKESKTQASSKAKVALQNILARVDPSTHAVEVTRSELTQMVDPNREDLAFSTDVVYELENATGRVAFATMASTPLGGQSLGRFHAATPASWAHDPSRRDPRGREVEPVEVSFLPRFRRNLNVVAMPRSTERYIAVSFVGEDTTAVSVRDLDFVHDGSRLWLVPKGQDVPLVVRNMSMFNFVDLATALVSTIMLVGREGERDWMPFPWLEDQSQRFLPEVLYDNIVLTKAAWRVPDVLFRRSLSDEEWTRHFRNWAAAVSLPDELEMGQEDNLLRFRWVDGDVFRPMRAALQMASPVVFKPAIANRDSVREYVHRVYVSGKRQAAESASLFISPKRYEQSEVRRDWVSMELPNALDASSSAQALMLLRQAARAAGASEWHFVNYRETDRHIRFRAQIANQSNQLKFIDSAMTLTEDYFGDMRLTFYRPEYQRYGGRAQFDLIASSFTASSDLAIEAGVKWLPADPRMHFQVAVSSAWLLLKTLSGDRFFDVLDSISRGVPVPESKRELKRQLATVDAPPCHIDALARMKMQLEWESEKGVVGSIVHMHANRFFGISPDSEQLLVNCLRSELLKARHQQKR